MKWIRVSDRLPIIHPNRKGECIYFIVHGRWKVGIKEEFYVQPAIWEDNEFCQVDYPNYDSLEVTHWMDLPLAPLTKDE